MPEQKTKFDDGRWKHEIRKVSDLHPNPDNPRTITKETLKGLKRSMQKNGYTHRIIVDCHNMILSGHARWLVFKEQDPNAEIECMVAQRELTKEEIQEAVLGHNTLGGEWNIEDLQMKFEPILLEAYGLVVDTGVTGRKLASDFYGIQYPLGGGTMHGKDLSKADCSVNIYCFLKAQEEDKEIKAICSIGDTEVNVNGELVPFTEIVEVARKYIQQIGGFEKLAEWGLQ